MTKMRTLAFATITLALAGGASAVETTNQVEMIRNQPQAAQSLPLSSVLGGEFRLSQTATCIKNHKLIIKGARLCMSGLWNYCNSRGLWEPSNQTC